MRKTPRPRAGGATELAESARAMVLFCVACGAVAGGLLPVLARLLLALPWAPLEGPAELLTSVPEPVLTLGTITAGVLSGLLLGFTAVHESLSVRVAGTHVTLTVRDSAQEFGREEISVFFRDGKQLVLLGPDGLELAREHCGLNWQRLADVLTAHGHTWAEQDPHRAEFRRWVPGIPGLPPGRERPAAGPRPGPQGRGPCRGGPGVARGTAAAGRGRTGRGRAAVRPGRHRPVARRPLVAAAPVSHGEGVRACRPRRSTRCSRTGGGG
ncbi:YqeB family protein [Streptomyces massasporeus]|uniref:YqeB family protein n=1 Tax=Streptomyces massasporeus TaxID=67324 RepID=UPI00332ED8AE